MSHLIGSKLNCTDKLSALQYDRLRPMSNRLDNIQYLRAFAAIWVVVYHARDIANTYTLSNSVIASFLGAYGYAGVDIFFSISGFVIYYSTITKSVPPLQFILRRIERIVPPYFILTMAYSVPLLILAGSINTPAPAIEKLLLSIFYSSFFTYDTPVIYVGWTLEYEMLFYLLAAISLIKREAFERLPSALAIIVIGGLVITSNYKAAQFITNPIVLEFGFGIMVAQWWVSKKIDPLNAITIIAALALLAANNPMHRVILAGIPSAILLIFAVNFTSEFKSKTSTVFRYIGDASYSIYLIQALSIPLVTKGFNLLPKSTPPDLLVFLTIIVTIASGCMFYSLIERPIFKWVKIKLNSPPPPLLPL